MSYDPLTPGGPEDYPVKVGSMLLTLVDPHKGYEKAYNRWYERDHYYGGCMIGPWLYAGSRWVATREMKDLRWPQGDETVAKPWDAGSYVAIYWVEDGHFEDHFDDWARPQVRKLYAEGRGFAERRHIHTILFDHLGTVYRDADPVPVHVALDAAYDGIVAAWFDATDRDARAFHDEVAKGRLQDALAGSNIESASSWTPHEGQNDPPDVPMDLGSRAGGPERTVQLFFVRGDVRDALEPLRAYTDKLEADNVAQVRLVAPFLRTVVGTDTYVDQIW